MCTMPGPYAYLKFFSMSVRDVEQMGTCAMAYMWRPEDNFVELSLFLFFFCEAQRSNSGQTPLKGLYVVLS